MSYGSSYPGLRHPKGESAQSARDRRRLAREALDRQSSDHVRSRSHGRCELPGCRQTAAHVHHLLGGHGRRAHGESVLAKNKVHLCVDHHRAIHDHRIRVWWDNKHDRFGTLRVEV